MCVSLPVDDDDDGDDEGVLTASSFTTCLKAGEILDVGLFTISSHSIHVMAVAI